MICFSIYRPPEATNSNPLFDKMTKSLSKAFLICKNVIIMGNFHIDVQWSGLGFGKLDTFCDVFNLTNKTTSDTCFMRNHKSTIDLILTNKHLSFKRTLVSETGLKDSRKVVYTFFISTTPRLKSKILLYRNYVTFDNSSFFKDLKRV